MLEIDVTRGIFNNHIGILVDAFLNIIFKNDIVVDLAELIELRINAFLWFEIFNCPIDQQIINIIIYFFKLFSCKI